MPVETPEAGLDASDASDDGLPAACHAPANFPGCGGGVNYCVVTDADLSVFAEVDGGTLLNTYDGGALTNTTCAPFCADKPLVRGCHLVDLDARLVQCFMPCAGRRPAGLSDERCQGGELGRHFGEMAFFEAASVHAFRILRGELRHYGAPRSLVRAAERAARDEVRHARSTRRLARMYGTRARAARVPKTPTRSLEAIALENAVEGCVRETYGALLATYQAHASEDPVVRALLTGVARDETRHAALAWRVASWLDRQLTPAARKRVREARHLAARELLERGAFEPSHDLQRVAGLPRPAQATALAEQLIHAMDL